jgi:hypothetical protein
VVGNEAPVPSFRDGSAVEHTISFPNEYEVDAAIREDRVLESIECLCGAIFAPAEFFFKKKGNLFP